MLRRDLTSLTPEIAGAIGTIRLDLMQAVSLMELLYPVKHTMFSTETDLMEMMGSDPYAFSSRYSTTTRSLMHPVTLVITIVSGVPVHETVVNTENSTGTFIKGEDLLPNWVIATGTQCDKPAEGSIQAMIKNWEDGDNDAFSFQPDTKEEVVFKKSKRYACIQNMPKFNEVNSSNLNHALSISPFATTPMCLALEVALKHLPASVMKCVDAQIIDFF